MNEDKMIVVIGALVRYGLLMYLWAHVGASWPVFWGAHVLSFVCCLPLAVSKAYREAEEKKRTAEIYRKHRL